MTQATQLDYRNPMVAVDQEVEPLFHGLTAAAWLKIALVTALMAATFRFNLVRLWLKTNPFNGEPNWRHAVCVPLIGLYYLFIHRDELLATKTYTAWSALGILLFGIVSFGYGIYPGQNDFVKDLGMVIALFGVVAMLCGWGVMKIAWFPIVFLVCALPWPELVYSMVASPLQRLAARVAVGVLRLSNVEAHNFGTKIIISAKGNIWRTLNVAEACAGLRSLMTFISVAAAVAFLSARPLWQKLILTFMAIPIAIFCNVMRVTGQGLLDHYFTQELSEGFAHQFVGIVMLVPGFFLIMFVGWLMDVVFIEVVDEREARRKRAAIVKPTQPVEWKLPRASLAGADVVEPVAGQVKDRVEKPAVNPVTAPKSPVEKPAANPVAAPKVPVAKPAVAVAGTVGGAVAGTAAGTTAGIASGAISVAGVGKVPVVGTVRPAIQGTSKAVAPTPVKPTTGATPTGIAPKTSPSPAQNRNANLPAKPLAKPGVVVKAAPTPPMAKPAATQAAPRTPTTPTTPTTPATAVRPSVQKAPHTVEGT